MDVGIVHDNREDNDECPTDPDVAGIGVSTSRDWHPGTGRADNIRSSYPVYWPQS